MKFRLEFDIKKLPVKISHASSLLLIGSCFTENIGEKLIQDKFNILQNPNGILFNPVSVAEALNNYLLNIQITKDQVFPLNEAWHSWKHHSRYSATTPGECVQKINEATALAHQSIKNCTHLLITLGSAWVYKLTEQASGGITGSVAANNHKAPAQWFHRSLLNPAEIIDLYNALFEKLWSFNPKCHVIFTISPVRHIREGAIENNRSKAVLFQAVHDLAEQYENISYFPAYELVIDDLRDYRFYAEDLVHPNYAATQYVWEKFVNACIEKQSIELMEQIREIRLAYHHKPFNPASSAHKSFVAAALDKAIRLQEAHPHISLKEEIKSFKSALFSA